ncbi:hypothetical protein [Halocatena pleomorpha]|uniref:Uncharacterized protein n=1 Tax=Halocatena pleomorpha TaxID=1785090 RepID=A0A3P3RAX0_9EURY|nr:hypothetical protein [Halocatena pleomorpha]RRJ30109.1 hypothetical protein EIK79_11040 [Halocatena pleomorpha]
MNRDRAIASLCRSARGLQLLFVVSLVSIGVLLASLRVVTPGSATHVITMVQLVTFAGLFALTGTALLICVRWS